MTLYAHTHDGAIDQVGALPALWLGPTRWHDWRGEPETWATQPADWGWQPVVETPRPADTATHTSDPAPVALIAGVPTQQWTVRPWTADELAAQATDSTRRTLDQKVRDAVVKGGTLDVSLGTTADVAPALTNAAIKVASLRSLGKLSNADTAANAGPIIQRLIALMIDGAQIDKRTGKLAVQLFDES